MVFVPLYYPPKLPSSLTRTRPPRFIATNKNLHSVLAVPGKAVRARSRRAQSKQVPLPSPGAACAVERCAIPLAMFAIELGVPALTELFAVPQGLDIVEEWSSLIMIDERDGIGRPLLFRRAWRRTRRFWVSAHPSCICYIFLLSTALLVEDEFPG